MKYTTQEALAEITRRSDQIRTRRSRCACRFLSGAAGVLFATLTLVITFITQNAVCAHKSSLYGSFLLSQEAGGYIFTAVIAFLLGIVTTLLCIRIRKTKSGDKEYRK